MEFLNGIIGWSLGMEFLDGVFGMIFERSLGTEFLDEVWRGSF